jgi:hypothetical protein
MNLQQSPTSTVEHLSAHNESETRLYGRWLFLARAAWVVITLLVLGLNIAAIPRYDAVLQTVCAAPANCFSDQLTSTEVQDLHALGVSLGANATFMVALQGLSVLVWVLLGALIFWRRSDEPMALFCSFMLVTFSGAATTVQEALAPLSLGWYALVYFLNFLGQVSFLLFFYLFPTGHFVPRWTRWTALLYAGYTAWTILAFHPGTITSGLDALAFFGLILTAVVAQVYRYRRVSTPSQRQQTKWVVFAFVLVIVGFIILVSAGNLFFANGNPSSMAIFLIGGAAFTALNTIFLLVPISIAIAILRSRLYDIDVVINKALVYGLLTTLLAAVYAGLIIGLESLAGVITRQGSQQPVVLVVSTLAIFALFQPLRSRIQSIIDRRFYRRKYDAAKTLEAFSATLRQEVDLDQLREQLVAVVQETMQPAHVSLWLRPPAHYGNHQALWRATPSVPSEDEARDER